MILYLHGFRSSPQSLKAQLVQKAAPEHGLDNFHAPQLPPSPKEAIALCRQLIDQHQNNEPLTIMGSSLGGYYATYLAETLDCRAVLINPAVFAVRDLSTQLGHLQYYHDANQGFKFTSAYLSELQALKIPQIHPERYLVLIGTADEVLDWQEIAARYRDATQIVVPGEDHGFSHFKNYLPDVIQYIKVSRNTCT